MFLISLKKQDFDEKLKNLNNKVTWNKSKHLLVKNEFKKLQTFDLSPFIGQSYFYNDGAQLYLIFQALYYTLKTLKSYHGNLNVCHPQNLLLLPRLIIVFLQRLNCMKINNFD